MNIAIDLRPLLSNKISGVELYITAFLKNLLLTDTKNKYFLWYNSFSEKLDQQYNYPNVVLVRHRYPNKLFNLSLSILRYPKIDRLITAQTMEKIDIFLVLDPRPSPVSNNCRKITVFHDLSFEFFKKTFNIKTRLWHKLLRPKKEGTESQQIITVSNSTKLALVNYYHLKDSKINVIYPGLPSEIERVGDYKKIIKDFQLNKPFLLTLSTLEPRKNLESLIKAYLIWSRRGEIDLVIVGKTEPHIFKIPNLTKTNNIKYLGFVSEKEKYALLTKSEGLCFPSLYEGFGFPILEAWQSKCPVLTSDLSSMSEIAQDAAILIDPYNPVSIRQGLDKLILQKEILIKAGTKALDKYNWKDNIIKFLKLLKS